MSDRRLHDAAVDQAAAIRDGRADPVELWEATLERITATAHLGAYLTVDAAGGRRAAEAAWRRRQAGAARSALDGVPIALKDNLVTRGVRTTCGSAMMAGWIPPYDGAAAAALPAAGAVRVGKTNLDEFGMGSSGEFSAFFPTQNPWDPSRVAGGSSSGSAVAVATGAAAVALGTDTGGSVRLPAAFSGVWGLMPTYGRVSRHGVVAHASSLDRVGVLARWVVDLAATLEQLAGPDPRDATCAARPGEPYLARLSDPVPARRVGRFRTDGAIDDAVLEALDDVTRALERLGHRVIEVEPLDTQLALDAYYVIASAEAASNLARFDGMRFGRRLEAGGFAASVAASRAAGLGPEVRRRIALGEWVTSTQRYSAVYERALRARTAIAHELSARLSTVDVLLGPVSATGPFRSGERIDDSDAMRATDRYTTPGSLAGLCGLTVPVRTASAPQAVLLTGAAFKEAELLALARSLEAEDDRVGVCDWASRVE